MSVALALRAGALVATSEGGQHHVAGGKDFDVGISGGSPPLTAELTSGADLRSRLGLREHVDDAAGLPDRPGWTVVQVDDEQAALS